MTVPCNYRRIREIALLDPELLFLNDEYYRCLAASNKDIKESIRVFDVTAVKTLKFVPLQKI